MRHSSPKMAHAQTGADPSLDEYLRIWNPRGAGNSNHQPNTEAFREGKKLAQETLKEIRTALSK